MAKNVRLIRAGDVVVDDEGNSMAVRGVSVVIHLANGMDMVVDAPGEVEEGEIEEISEEIESEVQSITEDEVQDANDVLDSED